MLVLFYNIEEKEERERERMLTNILLIFIFNLPNRKLPGGLIQSKQKRERMLSITHSEN